MDLNDYDIRSHEEIGEVAGQVYELAALSFARFPGVLQPSSAHRHWYVRRPGMDRYLSKGALHRGRLVGNVFVTLVQMRLGGLVRPVGMIDTVMTHPDHRRRGIARRLLTSAIEGMRERGVAASLLYTIDESVPYRFYRTLDYKPHAPIRYLRRVQPEGLRAAPALRRAGPSDDRGLVEFLNQSFSDHDGYVPLDQKLWRWRRRERPTDLPAETYLLQESGHIMGCITVCRASVVASTHASGSYVLADLAIGPQADRDEVLAALLSSVPSGGELLVLSAAANVAATEQLIARGFSENVREVGMLLTIDRELEASLSRPPGRWYVLTESVIGV